MYSKNTKVVALYGIDGLYNYGCEAIVRGTTAILREANPNNQIVYFSPRKEEDENKIKDLGIEVRQVELCKLGILQRIVNKALRKLKVSIQIPNVSYKKIADECDVLVSIGGDIYTIPKHVRKQKRYYFYNPLIEMGKCAKEQGKKLIIMGASIGPFGNYAPAVNYYRKNLSTSDLILAREEKCVEYLNTIGVDTKISFMLDPAFFVTGEKGNLPKNDFEKNHFGVNLSALSLSEINGEVSDTEIQKQARWIEQIIEQTGLQALLIPHVFSKNKVDNDYEHLKNVANNIAEEYKSKVLLVEPTSFLDAKKYIKSCKFVIAARMHCAVNSMCESVPAILLSYSDKSVGMAELIYGNKNWVLPLESKGNEIVRRATEMNRQAEELSANLKRRITEMTNSLKKEESYKYLKELIG